MDTERGGGLKRDTVQEMDLKTAFTETPGVNGGYLDLGLAQVLVQSRAHYRYKNKCSCSCKQMGCGIFHFPPSFTPASTVPSHRGKCAVGCDFLNIVVVCCWQCKLGQILITEFRTPKWRQFKELHILSTPDLWC